ncbi:class I SAM-dependent methyltransferase [Microvirga roseola]|uniref:class I SAM-dependent methyltransferase n=1 Tax=Microvirga roseola TaxID=2883126 RepID=UPI001E43619E|nr:class I SAM-dependent methyltransferase [Microvirga roseola]
MAQDVSGLRAVLSHPWVYNLSQALMGANRNRRWLQRDFIQAQPGERVLDVGCGTADILSVLPDVEYVGFDISEPYIRHARERWGDRGSFFAQHLDDRSLVPHGRFDLVLATGFLHHLDDDEVRGLLALLATCLRPDGRVITVDPCFSKDQNPVAKFIISKDRGRNVRSPEEYEVLARGDFHNVEGWFCERSWPPYTYWIMRLSQPNLLLPPRDRTDHPG